MTVSPIASDSARRGNRAGDMLGQVAAELCRVLAGDFFSWLPRIFALSACFEERIRAVPMVLCACVFEGLDCGMEPSWRPAAVTAMVEPWYQRQGLTI